AVMNCGPVGCCNIEPEQAAEICRAALAARHRLAAQPPAALPASPPDLAGVVEKLRAAWASLEINDGEEWFALIGKEGYDLCLERARYRPGQENSGQRDVIGDF